MKTGLFALSVVGLAAMATGCVERRVVYVPTYQTGSVYQTAPGYTYQPQTAYQAPPAQPAAPTGAAVVPQVNAQPVPPSESQVVAQAPPPLQAPLGRLVRERTVNQRSPVLKRMRPEEETSMLAGRGAGGLGT